jgi:tetratricopeptide (TPR) repeat protein
VGRTDDAVRHYEIALRKGRRSCGDRDVAQILTGLATLEADRAGYDQAQRHALEALRLAEQTGDRPLAAEAYEVLGRAAAGQGEPDIARQHLTRALADFEALGHHRIEAVREALARLARSRRSVV